MKKIFIYLFSTFLFTNIAHAYCSAPSEPGMFSRPTKPPVPYCVNEYARTHTCDSWEISSYNSSLQNYRYEVESYISDLQRYVNDARDYAECEIRNLD